MQRQSFQPLDPSDFERIVFFTGAGISAESGIPTFRGRGGMWASYDWQTIACQEAFDLDPEPVWDFHEWRRDIMADAEPNEGHRRLAAWQAARPGVHIITQNIDGLHLRAGAQAVIELHGSAWRVRCRCGVREELRRPVPDRRCARCRSILRPDVVWFGDVLDRAVLRAAFDAVQACDLFVSIGTSGVVYPAADLPALARRSGATCVEVNTEETDLTHLFHHVCRGSASDALGRLFVDQPSR